VFVLLLNLPHLLLLLLLLPQRLLPLPLLQALGTWQQAC
jgi:hypothetical protein